MGAIAVARLVGYAHQLSWADQRMAAWFRELKCHLRIEALAVRDQDMEFIAVAPCELDLALILQTGTEDKLTSRLHERSIRLTSIGQQEVVFSPRRP